MEHLAEYYRAILNSLPMPVFVLDGDMHIVDVNRAAVKFFGVERSQVLTRRGGDVLNCLYSTDVPEGCGRGPECGNCVARNSVLASLTGNAVTRRRMKFQTRKHSHIDSVELLVTATPLPYGDNLYSLLVLEDISELSLLKSLVPICMHCKKIRDDQQYWKHLENYFHESLGLDFSHGICPDCMTRLYPEHLSRRTSSDPV